MSQSTPGPGRSCREQHGQNRQARTPRDGLGGCWRGCWNNGLNLLYVYYYYLLIIIYYYLLLSIIYYYLLSTITCYLLVRW